MLKHLLMATPIVVIMKGESRMVMGSTIGLRGRLTLESSRRVFVKDKEGGSVRLVMSTRATIVPTVRMGGASSNGQTGMSIVGNSVRI